MSTHYGPRPKGNARSILNVLRNPAVVYTLKNRFEPDAVAIRVRRSSDNEQDDFTSEEIFDGTLESWVGGSNDGFIVIWYDQSGNEKNAVQNDVTRQPKIVDSGSVVASGGINVHNPDVWLDVPAFALNGTSVTVTASGAYRLGLELDGSTYRIYNYHIWDIELLVYYDRVLTDTEYENNLSGLERIGYTVDADFGTSWTNAFRSRVGLRDVSKLDFSGVTSLLRGFRTSGAGQWLNDNEDMFATGGDVTSFQETFLGNSITSVPENLFANNPNVTNFRDTFRSNSITSVPENLFANNPNVTTFGTAFYNNSLTSVPENLFVNNPNVTNFQSTFRSNSITSVPENLFANNPNVTNFTGTFSSNSITSVPENLFANNPNVTSFNRTFSSNSITSVPENLFANNPNVTNFTGTFSSNSITSVPENLFANNSNAVILGSQFSISSDGLFASNNLTSVPENLFTGCPNAENFRRTFLNNSITSIPENLFANNGNARDFAATFRSNSLTSVPENLFVNCPNAENFGDIVDSRRGGTFQSNSLTSIPENLFANCPNVLGFGRTFQGNSLTSIPENLFANNPNVREGDPSSTSQTTLVGFRFTFNGNAELTNVPSGLFDNQTRTRDYRGIFSNCALTQSSVDNVLTSVNNSVQANDITNGRIDITGGTNSPPSATGDTAITALIEKGWTVNVNS